MTGQPLRPEEQRSLVEQHPEIIGLQPRPGSPHDQARALVAQWDGSLGLVGYSHDGSHTTILLTPDVQDRMVADITKLLNDTISREHLGHV